MKRLFAYIGPVILFTLTIVFYFELLGTVIICALSLVSMALGLFTSKLKEYKNLIVIVSLVAVVSSFYSSFYTEFYYKPLTEKYLGQTVNVTAEICEQPSYYGNVYFYEIKATQVNGNEENIKMILSSPEELLCEYKDIINCRVKLFECEYPYYKSINAVYTARSDEFYLDYTVEPVSDKGIGYVAIQLREKLLHAVRTLIPGDEGDLCCAIALGDKHGVSADLQDKFQETGLSHFIVVSGMHLTVLVFIILSFLRFLPNKVWGNIVRFAVIFLFVITFMAITGFNASIVRSGITALLTAFGVIIWRKTDALNSLGIAAILQTVNPYAVGDVGLLLSYASVLGILILHPVLYNNVIEKLDYFNKRIIYYRQVKHSFTEFVKFHFLKLGLYIPDLFLLSFSAVVFVTPLTIIFFGTVTPVGILMSAILSLPIDVLLICTLFCSVLWYFPLFSYLTAPLSFVAYYIAKFAMNVVEFTAELPFAQIYVDAVFFVIWFIATAVIAGIVAFVKNNIRYIRKITACSSVLFILANMLVAVFTENNTSITVYPSGKGVTLVVRCNNQVNILSCGCDSENKSEVLDLLHKETDNVNLLIVPSTRNTEARLADDILGEFDVNSILLYYMSSTKEATYTLANECNNYYEFYRDDVFRVDLGGNLEDVVINVDNHTYQCIYNDEMSLLIIPNYGECQEIPEDYREADFVVMCDEPENPELISYEKAFWCSDEAVPDELDNVTIIGEKTIRIYNQ